MKSKKVNIIVFLGLILAFAAGKGLWTSENPKEKKIKAGISTKGPAEIIPEIAGYDSTLTLSLIEPEKQSGKSETHKESQRNALRNAFKRSKPLWANNQYYPERERSPFKIGGKNPVIQFWKDIYHHPVARTAARFLGIYLGIQAGVHYNEAIEQSAAMKREKEAALFLEYDFAALNTWLSMHIRGSFGYSIRPYVFQYGEIVSDYLTFGMSLVTYAKLSKDYKIFLDTGLEAANIKSYNYTSYENNKEYEIKMQEWLPLLKVSLGLENELSGYGSYFFELGFKYSLMPAVGENTIYVSHDLMSARDIYLHKQKQLLFFFFLGWKLGIL